MKQNTNLTICINKLKIIINNHSYFVGLCVINKWYKDESIKTQNRLWDEWRYKKSTNLPKSYSIYEELSKLADKNQILSCRVFNKVKLEKRIIEVDVLI